MGTKEMGIKLFEEPNISDIKCIGVKVRYHDEIFSDLQRLNQINIGDFIDLRAAEDIEMNQFEHRYISLGISIELPDGYFAMVTPRSSTYKNFGIIETNSPGIIDNSYSGDNDIWMMSALAMRDTVIKKGDRICQFAIFKKTNVILREVDKLTGPDRNGLGSTGKA